MKQVKEPSWVKNAIVYQIYPRSFKDSNNDGVGDLKGIIEKLDYLNDGTEKSLGVNAIWLSPIYPSPMVDFGYDVADYTNIDPMFGNLEEFDELVKEAHKRGIQVLMDYIPNHTSSLHPWFIESKKSKKNSKRDWYIWRDPKKDGSAPNNWLSVFGGSAWEFDAKTKQYYLHTFHKEQPDINWRNPELVKAMKNVLRFWLDRGVDGFRVDAVYFMFKHENFLDEPANPAYMLGLHEPYDMLLHPYTMGQKETLQMMKEFADVLEEYKDKFMVTETYTTLAELIKMYSIVSREWYAPFNFAFIGLPWTAKAHKEFVEEYDKAVSVMYLPTHVLGNHDKSRVATRIGTEQARNAAILLLTLRGVPFIYYGDELGMTDGTIPQECVQDPWEKNQPGLGLGRDPERTPMQWNSSKNAGFSDCDPWLPAADNYKTVNVEKELKDKQSMLRLYKTLIQFRHGSKAITSGNYATVPVQNENIYAYTRSSESEQILVVLNYSNKEQNIVLPFKKAKIVCNSFMDKPQENIEIEFFHLRPNEGYVFLL